MRIDPHRGFTENRSRATAPDRPRLRRSAIATQKPFTFFEFFAGGGMARAGLGAKWDCLYANEIDEKKAASYRANWGKQHLDVKDVARVALSDLPGEADLSWASFPCQDLSLAGHGAGLGAERSGTFWPFWKRMRGLARAGRAPKLIVLENVYGALTSHDGQDFAAIGSAFSGLGYNFGAMIVDAVHFLPQSRKRLFIVGIREDIPVPQSLVSDGPDPLWHPSGIHYAQGKLTPAAAKRWVWWNLPEPPPRGDDFIDIIEDNPSSVRWHTAQETRRLLGMMSPVNAAKVERAKQHGKPVVGGLYRRTRHGRQRAEVRFDDVSGCLRTPSGGSSRQTLLLVEGDRIRSRLLSPREAARLMGLPENYVLPENYNEAYHLAGDGVAVPAVRFLAKSLLEPTLLGAASPSNRKKRAKGVGRATASAR